MSADKLDALATLKKDPSNVDALNALLQKDEELDPELAEYFDESGEWSALKHPLVFSIMHSSHMNAFVNQQLRSKKIMVAKAEAEADWHSYIYLHERPYRVDAFCEIADRMSDAQYWYNLSSIWMDSENIRQSPRVWTALLEADRPQRDAMMNDDEHVALAAMPAVIPVYQGHTEQRHDGMSWTTDRAKAEWFAHRFHSMEGSAPVLTCGTVKKIKVIAYLTGRGEKEIIAKRASVKITERITLEPKDD